MPRQGKCSARCRREARRRLPPPPGENTPEHALTLAHTLAHAHAHAHAHRHTPRPRRAQRGCDMHTLQRAAGCRPDLELQDRTEDGDGAVRRHRCRLRPRSAETERFEFVYNSGSSLRGATESQACASFASLRRRFWRAPSCPRRPLRLSSQSRYAAAEGGCAAPARIPPRSGGSQAKPCRPHLRALIDQQQLRRAGGSSCAVRMAGFGAKSGAKDSKVGSAFRPAPASAAAAQLRACAADAVVRICAFPQP